jgi:hypothetical protein
MIELRRQFADYALAELLRGLKEQEWLTPSAFTG